MGERPELTIHQKKKNPKNQMACKYKKRWSKSYIINELNIKNDIPLNTFKNG